MSIAHEPWGVDALDLAAYLDRVGVPEQRPDEGYLERLYEAHIRAFPFETVDALLGRPPAVDLPGVQEKFLGGGRGGYCFEHGVLFAAALERLGYEAHRRLGTVGPAGENARTHLLVEVVLDGRRLLADPGFGSGMRRPIELRDGARSTGGGMTFGIARVPRGRSRGWELRKLRGGSWDPLHVTHESEVYPVDLVAGNHFVATHPDSVFQRMLVVTGFLPDGSHASLTHASVTLRAPDSPTRHEALTPVDLDPWLERVGVRLSDDDRALLHKRLAELPTAP
ncbi:arylamine N-acetyltransferase [Nocardiopsis sp. N85]|uniref:arylamine N-acetyltransferase family protein n=1 Tax=Nocardiopsis sp. N85 TaxID=3029400 RepID=UPI00237FBCD1|nr:arylamine N-acetyltransferase [Nocardiopsis sp. N85]MDE3720997.1 arylamine N-acetyltransferase [Nocardiopsis sp. N85]